MPQGAGHPKCGIELRLSPLPLDLQNVGVCRPTVLAIIKSRTCRYRRQVSVRFSEPQNTKGADTGAFQSKSGSAQRNTSIPHFGRIGARWPAAKGNPKTIGFWRRSFPHFFRC